MILRNIGIIAAHTKSVTRKLQQSYEQKITPGNLFHNPFKTTDIFSCRIDGMMAPYRLFLQQAKNGMIFFKQLFAGGKIMPTQTQ